MYKLEFEVIKEMPFIPVGTRLIEHTGYFPRIFKYALPYSSMIVNSYTMGECYTMIEQGYFKEIKILDKSWEKATKEKETGKQKKKGSKEQKRKVNVLLKEFKEKVPLIEFHAMTGYDSKKISVFMFDKNLSKEWNDFINGQTGCITDEGVFMNYEGDVLQFFDRYLTGKITVGEWD